MRIPLFCTLAAFVWLGIGLLIDDYVQLRQQVIYAKALTGAHGSLQQQSSYGTGYGPAANAHHQSKDVVPEDPKWTDKLLAWFTVALAISTTALFWDSREKGRKELRAYLSTTDIGIKELPGGQFQFHMTVENSGKTPAYDVRMWFDIGIGVTATEGFPIGALTGRTPIGPNGKRIIRQVLPRFDNDDQIRAVAGPSGQNDIFVWGRIEYRDIYDAPQHVNFRLVTRETITVTEITNGRINRTRIAGWPLQPMNEGNDSS